MYGGKRLRPFLKVILLGNSAVGKTCLLDRFVNKTFTNQFKATIGADFMMKDLEVDGRLITLQIWDTAGTERFSSIGSQYFRGADACLLVFDVTMPKSFEDVETWRREFVSQAALQDPAKFPFVLVGNKIDMVSAGTTLVGRQVVESYRSKTTGDFRYVETSAKDGTGVDQAFSLAAKAALAADALPAASRGALASADGVPSDSADVFDLRDKPVRKNGVVSFDDHTTTDSRNNPCC